MSSVIFLIGSADISGGTYVIFQHALYLQQAGIEVTLACMFYPEYLQLKKASQYWHPALNELHVINVEELPEHHYDIAIFTWWRTVYYLPSVRADFCVYFVQSIESKFYDLFDAPLIHLVNATYRLNMPVITEAAWIQNYLYQRYGNRPLLARNGIRKESYTSQGPLVDEKMPGILRVLIEGPLDVAFKNTNKTIELCAKIQDIEVWLLTSTNLQHHPKVDKVFSCVPIDQVGDIYRACDVLVKLSYVEGMFAPPLEMFHCGGTCIVYDVTGHDEYIKQGYNGIVVTTDHERGVIDAIERLKIDTDFLSALKIGALQTAQQWIDWTSSSSIFHEHLKHLTHSPDDRHHSSAYSQRTQQAFEEYEIAAKKSTP